MSSAPFKINYHNSRPLELEEDRYMDDELCRLNEPGARVHEAPRYQSEYEQLCENDEAAADLYDELLDRAVQHGLPVADNAETRRGRGSYRCPVGERTLRRWRAAGGQIPWCGEIRFQGSSFNEEDGILWRSYFHDLNDAETSEPTDDVLFSSLRGKKVRKKKVKRGEQDSHIKGAIDEARRWTRDHKQFSLRYLRES